MNELDDWINAVCDELRLTSGPAPDVVLDVARDVAHAVARPAAPLTAFLLGQAVAAGLSLDEAAARVTRLAATWTARPTEP